MSNREVIEWLRKKAETVPMPGARKMYEAAAKAIEAQVKMEVPNERSNSVYSRNVCCNNNLL